MSPIKQDGPPKMPNREDVVRLMKPTIMEEYVVSTQLVDGVVLIGTTKRVLEFDPEKGLRTLAHAEDIDGY